MEVWNVNSLEIRLQDRMRFEARNARGVTTNLDAAPPGGQGSALTPMEHLLAGLGGCMAMDVIGILRKKRLNVTDYRLEVTGVRALDDPSVYTEITIRHIVTGTNVFDAALRQAIQLSQEKYCPAYAMLSQAATISTEFECRRPEPVAAGT